MTKSALVASLGLIVLSTQSIIANAAVGRTQGSYGVSDIGAATYSIPIWTPPGIAGMQPRLSLVYSSNSGDGYLGVGWNLAGLASISRCPSTWAQDGAPRAVFNDAQDRFCLNGSRLRALSGTYGADGTEYRTEIESFARVISHGTSGNGPAYFTVETKDGLTYEYGHTTDSFIESVGQTTARTWALNKVSDRALNSMLYTYVEDTTNGSFGISSIQYTQNSNAGVATPHYQVSFSYEPLPGGEVDSSYQAGSQIKRVTRVNRIDVTNDGVLVHRYILNYESALSATKKSRLANVQECAGSTPDCFPATVFAYQNGTSGFSAEVGSSISIPSGTTPFEMDVNGDGLNDLVYPSTTVSGNGTWMVAFANTSGGYGTPVGTTVSNMVFSGAIIIDYNADGKEDLLVPNTSGTWSVMLGGTSGLASPVDTGAPATATGTGVSAHAFDIDGDGYDDLVWVDRFGLDGGDTISYRLRTPIAGGFSSTAINLVGPLDAGSTLENVFGPTGQGVRKRAPDFDGDGRDDIVYELLIQTGTPSHPTNHRFIQAFSNGQLTLQAPIALGAVPYFADFNGDGRTDILYLTNSSSLVARFSTGTSFTGEVTVGTVNSGTFLVVDWDGDGYDDVLTLNSSTSTWDLIRSTGESFALITSTGISTAGTNWAVMDINGDGLRDLGYVNGGTWRTRLHSGAFPDLLISATDGFGVAFSPTYVPITQNNYTKYLTASSPEKEFIGPLYVVNQFTASDGIGGSYSKTFWYFGARQDIQGRGFEGFVKKNDYDSRNQLYLGTTYNTAFPLTGTQASVDLYKDLGGGNQLVLDHTDNVLQSQTLTSSRVFAFLHQTNKWNKELTGPKSADPPFANSTTIYGYDAYGNATSVATTVSDNDSLAPPSPYSGRQWMMTTTTTIAPDDGTNWCLNLPTGVTVTSTVPNLLNLPNVTPITRTVTFPSPDYAKCREAHKVTEPGNSIYAVTEDYGFDGFGNVNSVTVTGAGMPARTTTSNWGPRGQFPMSVTNPLSQTTQFDYDFNLGFQTSITDPNGIQTTFVPDTFGRKVRENRPDGTATTWDISLPDGPSTPQMAYQITELGRDTSNANLTIHVTYFDGFARPRNDYHVLPTDQWTQVLTTYDSLGNVKTSDAPTAANANGTYESRHRYTYDALGRITLDELLNSSGVVTRQWSTSYQGLTSVVTDPYGKQTTKVASVVGTLVRSQDHNGYYQNFAYDAFGSLVNVTDSLSNTLQTNTYAYGIAAFKTGTNDMDLGSWVYTPNALGEVTAYTDAKGSTFGATYDALSRLGTRTIPDEGTITFTYGSLAASFNIGKLQSITKTGGPTETYTYDNKGRLSNRHIVSDIAYDYDYSYNPTTGFLDTLTYPASTSSYRLKLQYGYQNGALTQVKDANSSTIFWNANTINPRGQVTQETLGNGLVTNRDFDPVTGAVASIRCGASGGNCAQNQSYLYDLVGNLTQRQNNNVGLTENFCYDDVYRLDHSTLSNGCAGTANLQMHYDLMGNITSRSDIAGGATWTYSPTHKHQVTQAGDGSHTYGYDENGNATTRNGAAITWSKDNYPIVINGSGESTNLFYDAINSRWKQVYTKGSVVETTMYIGGQMEKVSVTGQPDDYRYYISANGHAVAIMSRTTGGVNATRYLLRDGLGSIAKIADSAGAEIVSESFSAFGTRRNPMTWSGVPTNGDIVAGSGVTREGYTGQDALGSMGLNHMNGRVQDAVTGRFLSADPFISQPGNTQNYNRYSYVNNNPLSFVDPSGFAVQEGKEEEEKKKEKDASDDGTPPAGGPTVTGERPAPKPGDLSTEHKEYAPDQLPRPQFGSDTGNTVSGHAATGPQLPGKKPADGNGKSQTPTGCKNNAFVGPLPIVATRLSRLVVTSGGLALALTAAAIGASAREEERVRVFYHYGYASDASLFVGGMRPGSFGTPDRSPVSGATAQQLFGLPPKNALDTPPDSRYTIFVNPGTPVLFNGPHGEVVFPASLGNPTGRDITRTGGGEEVIFPSGTPPGSVTGPEPLPSCP